MVKVFLIFKGFIKYEVKYNEKDFLCSKIDNFNWGCNCNFVDVRVFV